MTIPMSIRWGSDGKDSYFFPTMGRVQKIGLEMTSPGSDLTYYRTNYQIQQYFPLSKTFTLLLNAEAGYANGYAGKALPFYKNFYAGGVGSVRGYKSSSLGPVVHDATTNLDSRVGGNRRIVANAEVLWTLPGVDKSFRMGWFFDAGQVYGTSTGIFPDTGLRYSTGLSAAWLSPVGPLKFSIGRPISKKEGDQAEVFQFQMGTAF
jgi:outer membrane protein insertion porin family